MILGLILWFPHRRLSVSPGPDIYFFGAVS
jgi:hypothetical protein